MSKARVFIGRPFMYDTFPMRNTYGTTLTVRVPVRVPVRVRVPISKL